MPNSIEYRSIGEIGICPYCNYNLKNNKRGMVLHLKYSHNIDNAKSETIPDINICYCGKKNCKLH